MSKYVKLLDEAYDIYCSKLLRKEAILTCIRFNLRNKPVKYINTKTFYLLVPSENIGGRAIAVCIGICEGFMVDSARKYTYTFSILEF